MAKMVALITNFLLTILLSGSDGLPGGLHPTPPMGWTSWNTFFENNTEEKMISQVWQLGSDTEDMIPVLISWSRYQVVGTLVLLCHMIIVGGAVSVAFS